VDKDGKKIAMGLDVSTNTIGVCIILVDGSDYGKIIELTHISPKINKKIKGIEELCLKKKIFEDFIIKFKDFGIDDVIIEEPLLSSNNSLTVATLLRFNGMISDSVYNILGIVPEYISSYNARKFSFPDLMAIRKYGKDDEPYEFKKISKAIKDSKLVLFGDYAWTVDKKTIIQQNVSDIFPNIKWLYDKHCELKKENFDACDAYVACLGYLNMKKHQPNEQDFKVSNIKKFPDRIEYDVFYWGKTVHRTTYVNE
jgi:hypothetical protein